MFSPVQLINPSIHLSHHLSNPTFALQQELFSHFFLVISLPMQCCWMLHQNVLKHTPGACTCSWWDQKSPPRSFEFWNPPLGACKCRCLVGLLVPSLTPPPLTYYNWSSALFEFWIWMLNFETHLGACKCKCWDFWSPLLLPLCYFLPQVVRDHQGYQAPLPHHHYNQTCCTFLFWKLSYFSRNIC